jgi:hypothetical protein
MKSLERKISKMQTLNKDAILKLFIAEELYDNTTLSLDNAIVNISIKASQNSLNEPFNDRLDILYKRATKIANILSAFDENEFRKIYALQKTNATTCKILESRLEEVKDAIDGSFDIFYNINEMRKNLSAHNAYFYEMLNDIEKSYKTILNLVKRAINKWYKFITAKSLIITFVILTIVSLITFFIIQTDFHKGQTPTEAIQINIQESVQAVKEISNDQTLAIGEKVFDFFDLVTKIVGIVPQLLFLATIVIWILRQFFIANKRTNKGLSKFADKLDELRTIVKQG